MILGNLDRVSINQGHEKRDSAKLLVTDLDGTLIKDPFLVYLLEHLSKVDLQIDKSILEELEKSRKELKKVCEGWKKREKTFNDYAIQYLKTFYTHVPHLRRQQLQEMCNQIAFDTVDFVYTPARQILTNAGEENYTTCVMTHSNQEIADAVSQQGVYGFSIAKGTEVEVDSNGFYTGKFIDAKEDFTPYHKGQTLKRLVDKFGLELNEDTICMGDTKSDISMMEVVSSAGGKVICINPNAYLQTKAIEAKWGIVTTKKNVVLTNLPNVYPEDEKLCNWILPQGCIHDTEVYTFDPEPFTPLSSQ